MIQSCAVPVNRVPARPDQLGGRFVRLRETRDGHDVRTVRSTNTDSAAVHVIRRDRGDLFTQRLACGPDELGGGARTHPEHVATGTAAELDRTAGRIRRVEDAPMHPELATNTAYHVGGVRRDVLGTLLLEADVRLVQRPARGESGR